jgi:hypothetical protein
MLLVKDSHKRLFKLLTSQLVHDLGTTIQVYTRQTGVYCTYCYFDSKTGRSSGKEKIPWNTHPNYDGIGVRCPECFGDGILNTELLTTVNNVVIEDVSGVQMERGKFAYFSAGTKKVLGELSGIQENTSDYDSETILERAHKIVIYGEDYRLVTLNKLGLQDRHLFEAVVQKTDLLAATTS